MKGKIVGSRYKIIEYLAEGGFGRTYLAEDTQLPGRDTCLVKQLHPSSLNPKFLSIARRFFKTEASVLHNLGHHSQIPSLLAYFEEAEKFYLVQQYIKGTTLKQELDSGQIWSESQAIAFLQDSLNILRFVHDQGVIHRDIKPDNIIRRESDHQLVLVDFGSVKEVLQGQSLTVDLLTLAIGTQGYMPIEQARGKPRPSSDLYALGIVAIQALTGIAPLDLVEDDRDEIVWESSANVAPELSAILTRMTRYHFQDRYLSAADILQDLEQLTAIANDTFNVRSSSNLQRPISELVANEHGHLDTIAPSAVDCQDSNSQKTIIYSSRVTPSSTAVNKLSRKNAVTKIESPAELQSKKRSHSRNKQINIISSICVFIALNLVGLGVYLMMQQSFSDLKIDTPVEQPSETQTPSSNKRIDQGDGFRKEFKP
ncbi:MAG: serine/threonine-protein kinase [Cyanobacteria bacterium P01_G01_bin.19]